MLPKSMSLHLTAAPGVGGQGTTAVAYLNGIIVGSGEILTGAPSWFEFDIPEGLFVRRNQLQVQVLRQRLGGNCLTTSLGYPAQILPGSRFNLEKHTRPAMQFLDLSQAMQGGIDLAIDRDGTESSAELLARLAPIVASIVPASASIRPVDLIQPLPGGAPFIVVGHKKPRGSNPSIEFENGSIQLNGTENELLFDRSDLDKMTVVQIVAIGDRSGLWIRPGSGAPPNPTADRPLLLDQGDIAVLNQTGIALATSTFRPDIVRVTYPNQQSFSKVLNKYWPWIIGGVWIIFTILILQFLRRLHVKGKMSDGIE